jgi:uncharacterized protein
VYFAGNMTRIGLISDTHGYLDESIFEHFKNCDELWHGGDFGEGTVDSFKPFKTLKGVFGNIDGNDIRTQFPEQLVFMCEQVKVMIRHIGGYPPRYNPETKKELLIHKPQLFISGHSHILKIMYDDKLQCLHMNPGAAGKHGWHKMRTVIRFAIEGKNIKDCEVIELGKR